MAGITESGLQIKRLPEVLESMQSKCRISFGSTINLEEDSILSHLLTIFSAEVADLWEGVQGVYDAAYPDSSDGVNLDNVASLVGVTRLSAEKATAEMRITGTVNTVIPQGTEFEQVGSGVRFSTNTSLTLANTSFNQVVIQVTNVVPSTVYSVTIGGTTRSYNSGGSPTANSIAGGLVAAINTPDFGVVASNNLDGTFNITLPTIEERTLTISANLTTTLISRIIPADSNDFGEIAADPNTITIIKTPVFGMNFVTNPLAAVPGRNEETDDELRQRRLESVQIAGVGTVDAIRSALRQVDGVTNAIVIENDTNSVDGEGRPAKSFECVVDGGDDQDIGNTIWKTKPAGIETFGDIDVTVADSVGSEHTVYFSRPEIVYIHFDVEYTLYSEEMFPSSGEDAIKKAMADFGNTLDVGEDVLLQRFLGPIYSSVPGLSNVAITVATSTDGITPGSYTTNNVSISGTQVAAFDISRISVSEAP